MQIYNLLYTEKQNNSKIAYNEKITWYELPADINQLFI